MIGHPSGLPMKVTEGHVVSDDKERYFNTTLDIYQGNSGSPVFDLRSGEVHGIVIRGSGGKSFEVSQGCGRSKYCEDIGSESRCIGNHALRINALHPFLNNELQVIEHHELIESTQTLGFKHHFTFDQTGTVHFATLHLNAHVSQAPGIRVLLHHNGQQVEMIHRPKILPYGRWTATTFEFNEMDVSGKWEIEILEDDGSQLSVEWAQVMIGYTE